MPPITALSIFQAVQLVINSMPATAPSYTPSQVRNAIQLPLLTALNSHLKRYNYNWEDEVKPKGLSSNELIDILGTPPEGIFDEETGWPLPKVVVEIDTHRADQISKKFVSRQAIYNERPLIYVVYIYPNKHASRMAELKECRKYLQYIAKLSHTLGVRLITRCP